VSRSWLTLNQSSSDWEVAIAQKIAEAHLERIGGTWRFRLGVPTALRPIVGKREFRVSLKTSNLKEAKQRAHAECLKAEAQLDQARRTLAIRTGTAPEVELSDAEAWQLAREWRVHPNSRSSQGSHLP